MVIITDFNDVYELNVLESPTKITNFISQKNIKGSSTAFINEIDCTLFIGTNLGINVFQDSNYYFINKSQGLTNYNLLASSEYNSKLYILTTNVFFVLDKSYFDRKIESKAEITKMLVNNIQLNHIELESISKKLSLKNTENNLNIFFTAVNEKYPDKLIFKYRVKKNEPWIDLVNENEINLSYLDSGIYEIDIQINALKI